MDDDAEEIISLFDNFGILNIDEDKFDLLKRGNISAFDEEITEQIKFGEISDNNLERIKCILTKYFKSDDESEFWSALLEREFSPYAFEILCFILLEKESSLFNYGVLIYSILIGMEPANKIWNSTIFKPIISTLISTQHILENGGKLDSNTKELMELSQSILTNLTKIIDEHFINLIGFEVFLALSEIIIKLIVGIRVEFDKYNESLSNLSLNFLKQIPKSYIDYIFPFIIPLLLLQFACNTSTMTSRIEKLKEKLIDFILSILSPSDHRIVLICKHLIMRAPDKMHLRKGVAQIIFRLSSNSIEIQQIIKFCIKSAKTSKIGLRSFASYLIQLYLIQIEEISELLGNETMEIVIELSSILKQHLNDNAPTVRSMALDGIATLIGVSKSNEYSAVINSVINNSKDLENIFQQRVIDEKLIVRRSALNCLCKYILSHPENLNFSLIQLLSSRTRDKAVSIRQITIKYINSLLTKYPQEKVIYKVWLNSVLPLIVDPENSVQRESLDSISNYFFDPIINGKSSLFVSIMEQPHFDFMENVFNLYQHFSISLATICRAICKYLKNGSKEEIPYWKLAEILSRVNITFFKNKTFEKMWKKRNKLPPEYFLILAHLKVQESYIKDDCIKIIESELQKNTQNFKLLHSIIQLLINHKEGIKTLPDFLNSCCIYINNCTQYSDTNSNDLLDLSTTIFTLGEIIMASKEYKKILYDFDYTGLQILISEKLPNNVEIPSQIRALSTLSLGKLCIMRKDISLSFVSAFVSLLSTDSDPAVKCNSLLVLCDLCVEYTALVDPHAHVMTNCFADPSPSVRHQILHVITRLIMEDYFQMKPLLFFKYAFSLIDEDCNNAVFAQSCLFNVILSKIPDLLKCYFIDTIYYFSNEVDMEILGESPEEHDIFKIEDKNKRQAIISLIISKMNEITIFSMIQTICQNIFNKYIKKDFDFSSHQIILEDSIFALVALEDKMKQSIESEILNEDFISEKVLEAGKKMINDIHNAMIQNVLPIVNAMHRMLRDYHSSLQTQLKIFYQRICSKNPNLITQLEKYEPILAIELKREMQHEEEQERESSQVSVRTPPKSFLSPLLTSIASTPISQLLSPKNVSDKTRVISNLTISPQLQDNSN